MNPTTPKNVTPPPAPTPIQRTGIPGFAGILLYIILGLSALMLPLCATVLTGTSFLEPLMAEGLCLLYLLLLVVYFNRTAKLAGKISRGITPLMVALSCFVYFAVRSLVPSVLIFAFIFIIGEGSVLIATAGKKQAFFIPLAPLAAFALALVLFSKIDVAIIALLPFPAAVALAIGTRSSARHNEGLTRVGVICATSLVLGVSLLSYVLWLLYQALGTLEISALQGLLEEFRSTMIQLLADFKVMYGEQVLMSFTDKEEILANAVNSTINILPGMAVVFVTVTVTLAQVITLTGLRAYGFEASLSPRVREFRISPVSAVVFLLSWIVALVAVGENSASTVTGTVAENFFILLMPGLALAGVIRFLNGFAKKGGRMGCGFFVLLLVPCLLFYVPTALAFCEAVLLVFAPLIQKIKSKKKDPDTPSSDDPVGKPSKPLSDEELFDRYCQEQEKKRGERDDDRDDNTP